MIARAEFETEHASRYLAGLSERLNRDTVTTRLVTQAQLKLAFGHCDLIADDTHLTLVARADDQTRLDQVQDIVTRHLERVAFRENPQLEWRVSTDAELHP